MRPQGLSGPLLTSCVVVVRDRMCGLDPSAGNRMPWMVTGEGSGAAACAEPRDVRRLFHMAGFPSWSCPVLARVVVEKRGNDEQPLTLAQKRCG